MAAQLVLHGRLVGHPVELQAAPLALVRGRRRKRLLVRANREVDLQAYLAAWRARVKVPSSMRMVIDVDPYSFL